MTRTTESALYLYELVRAFMTQPQPLLVGQCMTLTVEEAAAIRQLIHIVPSMNLIVNVRPDVFVERTDP